MKNKIILGLMLILMTTSVLAYGGGGSGVFYAPTTSSVSNGNFLSHKVFQNQDIVTIDGINKNNSVSRVDVTYSKTTSGYVDLIETDKYTGNAFNQRTINKMLLLDSKEPFKNAVVYLNTHNNGKTISVWQRLDLGLNQEVWLKLDLNVSSSNNKTTIGSFVVPGNGLIMIAED